MIRPDDSPDVTVTDHHRIDFVRTKRWPTVVVVDDAQRSLGRFLEDLHELSDDRTKLILGTTDANWERQQTFRISALAAVQMLAAEYRTRRNEILPIVQQIDSHVGDDLLSTRLEVRIALAANSKTPWEFAYAVRGGWRETHRRLDEARDFEENDLLLMAVAVRQLVSLDAGASLPQLIRDAHWLGRDETWVKNGIQRLTSQRLVLCGESIRCLHLRSASEIVDLSLHTRSGAMANSLVTMIRHVVLEPDIPLQGISWLLFEIRQYRSLILTPEIKKALLQRCFNAHTHFQRRDASFVISSLLSYKESIATDIIEHYGDQVRIWIIEANGEDAYGIGSIINSLYNNHNETCKRFVESIEPKLISAQLSSLDIKDAYAWGYFLGRLSVGSSQEWSHCFAESLPREDVCRYVEEFSDDELGTLSAFIRGIAGFDVDFALDCCERALEAYKTKFADDALNAYSCISNLGYWLLGNLFFGKDSRAKRQRAIAKSMCDAIEPETIVRQIFTCPFGDWEYYARLLDWIKEFHPRKSHQIVDSVNWDEFDVVIGEKWEHPPRELRLLLRCLITNDNGEPIRSWLVTQAPKIAIMDPILAGLSPEAAVSVVQHGKRLDLGGHNKTDWDCQARAVAQIAAIDEDVAKTVLRQNKDHFTKCIKSMSFPEGLPEYLDLIHQLDDEILPETISMLKPADIREPWKRALLDHQKDQRYAARQTLRKIKIIAVGNTAICELADELLRSVRYRNHLTHV